MRAKVFEGILPEHFCQYLDTSYIELILNYLRRKPDCVLLVVPFTALSSQ